MLLGKVINIPQQPGGFGYLGHQSARLVKRIPIADFSAPFILQPFRHHGPFQQEEGEERCRGKHCWTRATQGNIDIT